MNQQTGITLTLDVGAAFPGVTATEETMLRTLSELSRNDALIFCAKVNVLVTGFAGTMSRLDRQRAAIALLGVPQETATINDFIRRNGIRDLPAIFFRGQLLELARWIGVHCQNQADEPQTFEKPATRSAFLQSALIASHFWSRRLFGTRLANEGDPETQLKRALGAFRKGNEEGNEAPHPGIAVGRGWLLFSRYFRKRLTDFDTLFVARTGLTLEQYYTCAFGLMKGTFATKITEVIFPTRGFAAQTVASGLFDQFVQLKSQTPEELTVALQQDATGYKALRERPIVNFPDNRSVILDPTIYFDTVAISPLFTVVRQAGSARQNEIFGAFGLAFEDYATDHLTRVFPTSPGEVSGLASRVQGTTTAGLRFEIDAILNEASSLVVFEMKASWLREDKILTDDHETFIEHIRDVYGVSSKPGQRPKGVAQLAKVIGALARGEYGEYRFVKSIYPVLLVHDERMATAGLGHFLDQEFRGLLGTIPNTVYIHPLIVVTIADLENLSTSIQAFSFMDFLHDYSIANPERMQSVHNFLSTSEPYASNIRAPQELIEASYMLGQSIKAELFPKNTAIGT